MDDSVYKRALERERKARKEAERVLEIKALELYHANQKLNALLESKTKALFDTEEKYRNIYDTVFDAIVILSSDGKIQECNKKFLEMVEYSESELKNIEIKDLVHPDDAEKSKLYFNKLKNEGFYKDYRGRIFSKTGKIIHIEVNSIALEENGTITGSVDVVRDVTDKVSVEKELFISSTRFDALVQNSSIGIVIKSVEGLILEANPYMENMLGFTLDELRAKKVHELTHPDYLEATKSSIKKIITGDIESFKLEKKYIAKDGSDVWGNSFYTLIRDESGNPTSLMVLIENISKWKQANKMLEMSEEKWRFVIENMELSLIEVDNDGNVTNPHKRFCELTGYSKEELIGKDPASLLIKDAESLKTMKKNIAIRKEGKNSAYELEIEKKNGEKAWLLISGAPLKNENQEVIGSIGIHMDITPRKMMLQDLEEAKQQAEDSAKAKENFLANMSHEIRTPMNAIMGMTRLLKESKEQVDKEKYLDAIENSAQNLLVIINDILDISKIEANKLQLESISFDLFKVLDDTELLLRYKTEEKGILLDFNREQTVPQYVLGDPVRLSQILTNLLSNAIKFTEKGSVSCSVQAIKNENNTVKLKFRITDTGIGIAQDKLDKIFKSFTQEDQATSRKFGGTGLGLAITKSLVELHNGSIDVLSTKNKGTTFNVEIDYEEAHQPIEIKSNQDKIKSLSKIAGARVLLVEDHEINKFLAETILTNWNMSVDHAYNGKEAIEKIEKENDYDIILMDVQMPIMDGLTTTKLLRQKGILTPIIALTANAIKGDDQKCLDAGMDDYVSKPIDPSTLFNKILNQFSNGK